jgi:protein ImuB
MTPERILVVHCVDWPVTAAGYRPEQPVAVVRANRVEACSAAARGSGVHIGMRRREAQRRNPAIEIIESDYARDTAMFEPVVKAIIRLAPLVEVYEPGTCMVPTVGPSRYYGGDEVLFREMFKVATAATQDLGAICQIGIANGPFAARLAARSSTIVPSGETAEFLAPHSLEVLERPDLTSLLNRLGIRTLGGFAEMKATDISSRFGPDGMVAHRLALGLDQHHLVAHPAPVELTMSSELDPPADRIDIAAFTGRSLAVDLLNELTERSLTCTRVTIEAETENGETLSRCWRFDGVCTEKALSERVRWQLEGWLSGAVNAERPTGGVSLLRLIPDQLRPNTGEQHNFWNVTTVNDERAARGFSRLQALLGPDAVQIAAVQGGRHPAEQALFTAWGEHVDEGKPRYPWPDALPPPAPSVVHAERPRIEVLDDSGRVVTVNRRGVVSRHPSRLRLVHSNERIIAWAGPWTSDDQWWDAAKHKRQAFLQIVTESGAAHLVAVSGGGWFLDATYD